tara:strand:+ start:3680 stop:4324 length:645 start_codon:yes stop_codon:yes gene_type:complete
MEDKIFMYKKSTTFENHLLKHYFNKLPPESYVNYQIKQINNKQWYLSFLFNSSDFPINGLFMMTVTDNEKVTFKLSTKSKLNKKILSKAFSFFKIENVDLLIKETLSKQQKTRLSPYSIFFNIKHNEGNYKLLNKLFFNEFIRHYSLIKDDIIISEDFCYEVYDILGDSFIDTKITPIRFYEKLDFESFVNNNKNKRSINEEECLNYLKLNFGI